MASSSRKDIRYQKLSNPIDTSTSSSNPRRVSSATMGNRKFTRGRRLLPKLIAVIFVFCILLLFQYGSRIVTTLNSEEPDPISSSSNNFPGGSGFHSDDNAMPSLGNINLKLKDPDPPSVLLQKDENDLKDEIEKPLILDNSFQQQQQEIDNNLNLKQDEKELGKDFPTSDDDDFDKYQLNLETCKIPKLRADSKVYKMFENEIIQLENCSGEKEVSDFKDGIVTLHKEYDRKNCCIYSIHRPPDLPSANDSYELSAQCEQFDQNNQFNVGEHEFVFVSCTTLVTGLTGNSSQITTDYSKHANVVPSKFKEKISFWNKKPKPFNIIIVVLDSVSKMDGKRNLPKTMKYLLDDLQFIDFNGYHAISEPTMKNVIPLFLGTDVYTFYKNRTWADPWDPVPFIWKRFESLQFLTGYLEDIPDAGTFNYHQQRGFIKQPTDFYLRPFFSANVQYTQEIPQEHEPFRKNIRMKYCVGKKSIEEVLLEYQSEVLRKMNDVVPLFMIPWPAWPQHDYFGTTPQIDDAVFRFFNEIGNSKPILDNTLMILMGDHGFYNGGYSRTHEGLLERRHPLFLIKLPKSLTNTHPEFLKNIQDNANRVTSHYDVHKTLVHISELVSETFNLPLSIPNSEYKDVFGQSLLLPISKTRTCEEAGIRKLTKRCACNLPLPPLDLNLDNPIPVPDSVVFQKEPDYVTREKVDLFLARLRPNPIPPHDNNNHL